MVDPEGPLHGPRREVVVVASSFQQARIIFEDVLCFMNAKYDTGKPKMWARRDSTNEATLTHRESGARVRCIGSDPKRAHGLRPYLILADEPAQWPTNMADRMLAALRTSLGKVPGSRMIALGTRAIGDTHWFSVMLNGGADYARTHASGPDDPTFTVATMRKANPSFDHLPSLRKRLASERDDARRDDNKLAEYRALRLNQGVSEVSEAVLFDVAVWRAIEGEAERTGAYVLAVDPGTNYSMTGVAAYWPETGALDVFAVFPELPYLGERGRKDQVGRLYLDMERRGELLQFGNRTTDLTETMREVRRRWNDPAVIVSDAWRKPELVDALEESGIPVCPFAKRVNGPHDGTEDWRAFQRAVLDGNVTPTESLLLRWAMAESRLKTEKDNGNAWLGKKTDGGRRARARDDVVAASILAVSYARRVWGDDPPADRRRGMRLVA